MMKKLIPLCLALILSLALAVPASAAESGAVAVQVNGELVTFPNAAPELKDGRTMVPMRAVLEALGAEVDYDGDAKTVEAVLGETTISHVIGENKIIVDGDQVMTMDTVSYVKSGSTLVPLCFFSQALGYEVYWDGGARTAVVIDKKAAVAGIDKKFSITNDFRAKQALDLSAGLDVDMDFAGSVKLLDSISGDRELPFSMEMSALYTEKALNASGKMDLSLLSEVMKAAGEEVPQELEAFLKDLSFQIIYSGSSLWMEMPALTEALRESGEALPEGEVWMKTGVEGLEEMEGLFPAAGGDTVGGALYAMAELADKDAPARMYEDLTRAAELMAAVTGDSAFTKSGGDYVWKMDEAMFDKLAEALGASDVSFPGAMEMTLKADGSSTFSMNLTMEEAPLAVTMTLSGTSSAKSGSFEGRMQVKNVCDVVFRGQVEMEAAGEKPLTAPPADATVVDLDAPSLLAA